MNSGKDTREPDGNQCDNSKGEVIPCLVAPIQEIEALMTKIPYLIFITGDIQYLPVENL